MKKKLENILLKHADSKNAKKGLLRAIWVK